LAERARVVDYLFSISSYLQIVQRAALNDCRREVVHSPQSTHRHPPTIRHGQPTLKYVAPERTIHIVR